MAHSYSKKKTKPSTATESEVKYTVNPMTVPFTTDPNNPATTVLRFNASPADSSNPVEVATILFVLPVGEGLTDLVASGDVNSINPSTSASKDWSFTANGGSPGQFVANPIPPNKGIAAGETISFELQNVKINQQGPSPATITIIDTTAPNNPIKETINKVSSDMDVEKFQANPPAVQAGGTTSISWESQAVAQVTLSPEGYYKIIDNEKHYNPPINPSDSVYADVDDTTTYYLTAKGAEATIIKQFTVSVEPVKILSFTSSSYLVNAREKVTLSWEAINAETCSIANHTDLALKSTLEVEVWWPTTYILTASSKAGTTQTAAVSIDVNPVKINSFTANPMEGYRQGSPLQISWDIDSVNSATILPQIGNLPTASLEQGTLSVQPFSEATFTLNASGFPGPEVQWFKILPMPLGWFKYSQNAPFTFSQRPVVLNLNNQMYAFAGGPTGSVYTSFNGVDWTTLTTSAAYSLRSASAGAVFQNKLWLLGGAENAGGLLNDVWSSEDGITWTNVTSSANWSARKEFGCFVLGDSIYVLGGVDASGNLLQDVWSSPDGKDWTRIQEASFSYGKAQFGITTRQVEGGATQVWVSGGLNGDTVSGGSPGSDSWYSTDGKTWNSVSGSWTSRTFPNVAGIEGKIYLYGGVNSSNEAQNDFYVYDGSNWSVRPGPQNGLELYSAYVTYQKALWLVGGGIKGTTTVIPNKTIWAYAPVVS